MIKIANISLLAWSYTDGHSKKTLTKYQEEMKLVELPSLYEYLSYCVFFPLGTIGPCFDYKDFDNFMSLKGNYKNIPWSWKEVLSNLFLGFFSMGVILGVSAHYNFEFIFTPEFDNFSHL